MVLEVGKLTYLSDIMNLRNSDFGDLESANIYVDECFVLYEKDGKIQHNTYSERGSQNTLRIHINTTSHLISLQRKLLNMWRAVHSFSDDTEYDYSGVMLAFTPTSIEATGVDEVDIPETHFTTQQERYIDISNTENVGFIHSSQEFRNDYIGVGESTNSNFIVKVDNGFSPNRPKMFLKIEVRKFGFASDYLLVPFNYQKSVAHSGKATYTLQIPKYFIVPDVDNDYTPLFLSFNPREEASDTFYEAYIDNKPIRIRDGFTIKEELNETLDSGTFEFVSIGGEFDFEAYDDFVIENSKLPTFKRKHQLIDTYTNEIVNFNKDNLEQSDFSYVVNIFSETKQLEKITLPDLTITKRANGSAITVWEKIKEYFELYAPDIRVPEYNQFRTAKIVKAFYLDPAMANKFNVPCPDMSWENPTLKEVLTDLMYVKNCIPIIKDNVLTYYDISYKGNPIDTSKLTNTSTSHTSADYVNEITQPLKNVSSQGTTKIAEYITPRSVDNSGEITTDNACWITSKPIYAIKKAIVYFNTNTLLGNKKLYEYDLTNWIIEKQNYETLNSANGIDSSTDNPHDFQLFHLYYKRGSANIENVGKSIKAGYRIGLKQTSAKLSWVISGTKFEETGTFSLPTAHGDIREAILYLEYETIDESTVNISRETPLKHPANRVFDNQKDQMVDMKRQGIYEYAKINRLGNKIKTIYGEYFDERDIPELGDYIGDKILFSREITYYDDIMYFKGMLCDNYIIKDYFTSVFAKKRSWNIVSSDEAIIRNENLKAYISFLFSVSGNNINNDWEKTLRKELLHYNYDDVAQTGADTYCSQVFGNYLSTNNFKSLIANNKELNMGPYSTNGWAFLDFNVSQCGKSIVFSAGYLDNFCAGHRAIYVSEEVAEETEEEAGYFNRACRYVDENGEATEFEFRISNIYNAGGAEISDFEQAIEDLKRESDPSLYLRVVGLCHQKPLVFTNCQRYNGVEIYTGFKLNLVKDNREALKISAQYEYGAITNGLENIEGEVIVKDKLVDYHWAVRDFDDYNFRVYRDTTLYKKSDNELKSTATLVENSFIYFPSPNVISIVINHGSGSLESINIPQGESLVITNENDEILMVLNNNSRTWLTIAARLKVKVFICNDLKIYNNIIDRIRIADVSTDKNEMFERYEEQGVSQTEVEVFGRKITVDLSNV